jgi:hypothetical protein
MGLQGGIIPLWIAANVESIGTISDKGVGWNFFFFCKETNHEFISHSKIVIDQIKRLEMRRNKKGMKL